MWVVLGGREAPAAVGLVGGCRLRERGIVALENSLSQNEESSLRPYPVYSLPIMPKIDFPTRILAQNEALRRAPAAIPTTLTSTGEAVAVILRLCRPFLLAP